MYLKGDAWTEPHDFVGPDGKVYFSDPEARWRVEGVYKNKDLKVVIYPSDTRYSPVSYRVREKNTS